MLNKFITEKKIKTAIQHIIDFGDTDIFPPIIELDFFKKKQKECLKPLIKLDEKILQNSFNCKQSLSREIFFSFGQGTRLATQLPFFLTLYSILHAFHLREIIERKRTRYFDKFIHSYRCEIQNKKELFSKEFGWNSFLDCQKRLTSNYNWVVSLDIAKFYSSIKKLHLQKIGDNFLLNKNDLKRIYYFFDATDGHKYGLPLGRDYSRLIADTVLYEIDLFLLKNDLKFCRFVDDYKLFFLNQKNAINGSYKIIDALSTYGFNINNSKFDVKKTDKSKKKYSFNQFTNNKIKTDNYFFDPYSEMVLTKIKELKSFSQTKDLLYLINLELEKIAPHTSSLKIYMAALQIAPPENFQECFVKLLSTVFDERYFALLPKMVRLTSSIRSKLDENFKVEQCHYLKKKLILLHSNLPLSVIGQILRIIKFLSYNYNNEFLRFLLKSLKIYKDSLFVQREIVNLLKNIELKRNNSSYVNVSENIVLKGVLKPETLLRSKIYG